MQTIKCPRCNLINFPTARTCKRCGAVFSENSVVEKPEVQFKERVALPASDTSDHSIGNSIIIFVWVMAIMCFGFAGFVLFTGVATSSGAPQEAAVAGYAACFAIIPYCIARGVNEIIRVIQGK